MSAKHTPGPWRLDKRGNTYIVDKPGDGYITRDVCRMDFSTMSAFHQEGNARLIAAAPELLEALKACDEAMSYMSEYDIPITLPAQVKAAIAKAEGGAA